jgi:Neocarzinostatin family
MRLRLRIGLAAVSAMVAANLLGGQVAQAQEGPTITVTPSTGLAEGQTVTVSGSGFGDLRVVAVVQCAGTVGEHPDVGTAVFGCDFTTDIQGVAEFGGFSTTFVVSRQLTLLEGQTVDCRTASEPCRILVGSGPDTFATAPISFGPPTPPSRADCKKGGWRNLADHQGRPFRNQGQCVRYVVAARR